MTTTTNAIEVAGLRKSYGDQVRASIGVTGQFSAVDDSLTGREKSSDATAHSSIHSTTSILTARSSASTSGRTAPISPAPSC